jgi:hypothetical protein
VSQPAEGDAGQVQNRSLERAEARLAELAQVALELLPSMLDEQSGLFSHKTVVSAGRYVNREPNLRYSSVSLVGLLSQRRKPADSVVPLGRALDAAHSGLSTRLQPGTMANLVWASTLADDPRGADVLARLLEVDPRRLATGQIGLVLNGLTVGADAYGPLRDPALRCARACTSEVLERFRPGADVFAGSPSSAPSRRQRIEGRITSFASQVYPLHGLAAFHLSAGEPVPAAAVRVANRIVDAQGPLGQWWWLYSSVTPRILEGYPVYSVHQDGMAFLGLVGLERLGAGSFGDALTRGLDWLSGRNELAVDLVERSPTIINRCIQRVGSDADGVFGLSRANLRRALARSLAPRVIEDRTAVSPERLEVLRECRSYHLGWLLYADSLVQAAVEPAATGGG